MRNEELKPVNCGCGGEAKVKKHEFYRALPLYSVKCNRCGIQVTARNNAEEAVTAWNTAMSGSDYKTKSVERTAKVMKHHYDFDPRKDSFYHGLGGTELLCGACKKKVLSGEDYCSHCGARLEWE